MALRYRAGKDTVTGQTALFGHEEEGLPFHGGAGFPLALFMPAAAAFPLPVQQLAENMADLLNRKVPRHSLHSGDEAVFYSRVDNGIMLRTKGDGGVSVPALSVIVSSKSSVADLGHEVLARMDQDFMKRVCDTIVPESAPEAQRKGPGTPVVHP